MRGKRRSIRALALLAATITAAACGKKAAEPVAATAAAADAAPAADPGAALAVPEGATLTLAEPTDGAIAVVPPGQDKAKVHVKFDIRGMEVRPAGAIVAGTGHHHLMINEEGTPLGQAVPKNATNIHYGKGETEADVELSPGRYRLTAQFANGAHLSYGDKLRATIHLVVEAPAQPVLAPGAPAPDPAGGPPPPGAPPPSAEAPVAMPPPAQPPVAP